MLIFVQYFISLLKAKNNSLSFKFKTGPRLFLFTVGDRDRDLNHFN